MQLLFSGHPRVASHGSPPTVGLCARARDQFSGFRGFLSCAAAWVQHWGGLLDPGPNQGGGEPSSI